MFIFICLKMFAVLFIHCCFIAVSLSHNIDIEVGPILKTHTPASYFGYSATGVVGNATGLTPWVAVGSPQANTSNLDAGNKRYMKTGALYECPITMDQSDCTDRTTRILTDTNDAKVDPTDGWYGVSVVGGREQDISIMVCSHRQQVQHFVNNVLKRIGIPGLCIRLSKHGLVEVETITYLHRENEEKMKTFGETFDYKGSRFGQTGISAAVGMPKQFYAGAVGQYEWSGSLVTDALDLRASKRTYSYGGYSLAYGSFFKAGASDFAVGAPRSNDAFGAVLIFDKLKPKGVDPEITIIGNQYGSYFGMSVCAGDFDGDKISEVVVGAPYYAYSRDKPNTGEVYVYSHKDGFKKPLLRYSSKDRQSYALFGRAVSAIGDVDQDDFNDLAIGSPFEGKGGSVYIYFGSRKGLSRDPVQIIKASDFPNNLHTFGWSVEGGKDLDNNGYPDIVVGAYASDAILVLRSVPVVDVDIQYKLSSQSINISNRNCFVDDPKMGRIETVCFNVSIVASYQERAGQMTKPIELSFSLNADTMVQEEDKKRVLFLSTNSPNMEIKKRLVRHGKETSIITAHAYLKCRRCPDKISPYPDVGMTIVPYLPKRPKPPTPPKTGPPPSLQPYFQLPYFTENKDARNVTFQKIVVQRSCNPCRPNLKIENIGTEKIPVLAKDITLQVKISNSADEAYRTELKVDFPPPLRYRPCGPNDECLSYKECKFFSNDTQMRCDLEMFARGQEKIRNIKVDTSKASQSLSTYEVKMNVSSANEEETTLLNDNSLTITLTVASQADIGIEGVSSTPSRYYGGAVRGMFAMTDPSQIGLTVEHRYIVRNSGPDEVPEVNFTIEWPYEASSGKYLLYLMEIKEDDNVRCNPESGVINPLQSQFVTKTKTIETLNKGSSNRTRRSVDDGENESDVSSSPGKASQVRKGSKSKIVLDCANGTARCVSIPCTVTKLTKTGTSVSIISRIWNGTLLEDYTDRDVVVISRARIDDLTSYVTDNNKDNHHAQAITTFFPASPKTTKKEIAVWIIVVSAIAGVVLLVILIVVFKMCGFFNRMGTNRYDAVPEK